MSALNEDTTTMPDPGGTSFNDKEKGNIEKNLQRLRDRQRAKCKHLVKAPPGWKRKFYRPTQKDYDAVEQKVRDAEQIAFGDADE